MRLFKQSFGGAAAAMAILFASQAITPPANAETLVFELSGTVRFTGLNGRSELQALSVFGGDAFLAVLTVDTATTAFTSSTSPGLFDRARFAYTSYDVTIGTENFLYAGGPSNMVMLTDRVDGFRDALKIFGDENLRVGTSGFQMVLNRSESQATATSIADVFDLGSLESYFADTPAFGLEAAVLTSAGAGAWSIRTDFRFLSSRQITTVPEPATWLMMILGFAGVGLALKVRRRRFPLTA